MLWSPAASSSQQRARVLTDVKARRFAPPPLRGADGLDVLVQTGSCRRCPLIHPLHVVVAVLSRMTPFPATVDTPAAAARNSFTTCEPTRSTSRPARPAAPAAAGACHPNAVELQYAGDGVIKAGGGGCFDQRVDAAEWFAVADFLCSLVRQTVRSPTKGLSQVLAAAGIEGPLRLHAAPGARIELLGVEDRQALLEAVWCMMRLHPNALREALTASGVSRKGLLGGRRNLPEALGPAVPTLPELTRPGRRQPPRNRPRGPRPQHEVRAMMKRLERQLERTGP